MLVCHCNGVSDRKIRRVIRDGATTPGEVARATGAGTCCGGCRATVKQLVRAEVGRLPDRTGRSTIVTFEASADV